MSTNYQIAVRKSFERKIGVFLQQNGSRDMSLPLNFNKGTVDFLFDTTPYGIVPLEAGQAAFYPGVSLLFLSEEDASGNRSHSQKKRYILPVKIIVGKEILVNTRPQVVKAEVLKICKLLLECLSDGHVEIWDYDDLNSPVNTGVQAWYSHSPYSFGDESLAFAGGDIRCSTTIFLNYLDPSF